MFQRGFFFTKEKRTFFQKNSLSVFRKKEFCAPHPFCENRDALFLRVRFSLIIGMGENNIVLKYIVSLLPL